MNQDHNLNVAEQEIFELAKQVAEQASLEQEQEVPQ